MPRTARIEDHVLAVLTGAVEATANRVVITRQLPRPDYVAVDKVLRAAGCTWSRQAKAHLFPVGVDADAVIDQLCLSGAYNTGQDDGWFPTRPEVADRIVELADVKYGMSVLEPSAGEGALIAALLRGAAQGTSGAGLRVVAVERDATRNNTLHKLQHLGVAIHDVSTVTVIEPCDFLTWTPGLAFDRVVMNPPFVGTTHLDHVKRAFSTLRSGGRLVSILPAGVQFRQDRRHVAFRAWLVAAAFEFMVEDLAGNAFNYTAKTKAQTVTPVRSTGVRTFALTMVAP